MRNVILISYEAFPNRLQHNSLCDLNGDETINVSYTQAIKCRYEDLACTGK